MAVSPRGLVFSVYTSGCPCPSPVPEQARLPAVRVVSQGGVPVFTPLQSGSWLGYMLMCSGRT